MNVHELTGLFRRLGAKAPAEWAESQLHEGIPQLARFLFLRQAWKRIVPEDDPSWIDANIDFARREPDAPYAGAGHTLASLRERGATDREVTELVRSMQAEFLFGLCQLLEDPGIEEPELADTAWGLFLLDDADRPTIEIGGLHESVLSTDPSGREARPRPEG